MKIQEALDLVRQGLDAPYPREDMDLEAVRCLTDEIERLRKIEAAAWQLLEVDGVWGEDVLALKVALTEAK